MNPRRSLPVAALLLALGIAALWWITSHRQGSEPATVSPATTSEPVKAAEPVVAVESSGSRESAARPEADSGSNGKDKPADDRARIRARFLDVSGKAVAKVALSEVRGGDEALGESAADGRLETFVRVWNADGTRLQLEARHPEYVARTFERVVRRGDVLDLGDVQLERGGVVSGRVVDEIGRPAAKVAVHAAPAGNHHGPARMSDGPYNVTNSGTTDEHGQFRFAGVPAGDTRAWAFKDKPPWSFTEPFAVREGEETRALELVLKDRGPEAPHSMRFLVRTPEGAPAPGIRLAYRARDDTGMSMGSMTSNAEGIAALDENALKRGGKIDVDASDPAGRWGAAALLELTLAVGDNELRMTRGHAHQLLMQSADGTPVTEFTWRMLDRVRFSRPDWTRTRAEPVRGLRSLDYFDGGVLSGHGEDLPRDRPPPAPKLLTFASGDLPFVLQIDAPGFERAEAGPFVPATAPEVITITLEPLPEIRGTVVHAKQPVAGAAVRLMRATPSLVNGFPNRVAPQPVARTESDAEGRFHLPFREAGSYVVQAQSTELGIGEYGPVTFALTGSRPDVLVEIADPGRIEGHLLLPKDSAGEDWIVGASRGDGKAYSCRASHEGAFHFDKLAPGRWLLHSLEREIAGGEMSWSAGPEPTLTDAPWPYEVRSGETTKVEIDLRQEAQLAGTLMIPGWEGASWNATLEPEGTTFGRTDRAAGSMDGSEFHLEVRPPGTYRLVIFAQRKDGALSRSEIDSLTLVAGTQSWAFTKSVGTVVLVNRREAVNSFQLCNDLAPGRSSTLYFSLPGHSELTLTGVFAGGSRLTRFEDMQAPEAGPLEVQPGATLRFDRP